MTPQAFAAIRLASLTPRVSRHYITQRLAAGDCQRELYILACILRAARVVDQSQSMTMSPLETLRHHVTGAIERGEAAAIDACPTCCRAAGAPYRVYDSRGKVVQGCVDDFHSGHLVSCSESNFWHNRKQAKQIRGALLARRNAS